MASHSLHHSPARGITVPPVNEDHRNVIRSWSAVVMGVVGLIGGVLSLLLGARLFGSVCLLIVGVCGVGLLVTTQREGALRFRRRYP